MSLDLSRNAKRLLYGAFIVGLAGCGGDVSNSFVRSVYIQITGAAALQPTAIAMPNGYRVVFLNNDSVAHTINWNSPLTLSATAQPGDRAWFDLPTMIQGTVLSYHLDGSGASGSVTIISTQ